jgi:hypothetical protein
MTIYFEPYKTNKDIEVTICENLWNLCLLLNRKERKGLRKGREESYITLCCLVVKNLTAKDAKFNQIHIYKNP